MGVFLSSSFNGRIFISFFTITVFFINIITVFFKRPLKVTFHCNKISEFFFLFQLLIFFFKNLNKHPKSF